MKIRNLLVVFMAAFAVGCSAPKNMISYKENAEIAERAGNFAEATEAWKNYFSQFPEMNDLDGEVYA
ncbi:MAG: hypothetical protein ACP5D9_12585, partial [Mariniphaga sp.]